jgi:hypothetical protein
MQMRAVEALCLDILGRHAIPPDRVLAHSDIAPGRKRDPGEKFDWQHLARAGIGLWVEPVPLEGDAGLGPGDEGEQVAALQISLSYGTESSSPPPTAPGSRKWSRPSSATSAPPDRRPRRRFHLPRLHAGLQIAARS